MVIFCCLTVFWLFFNDRQKYSKPLNWCTNRHRSTKTVPIVCQRCTNRQKTVKTGKIIIGVPIVTCLPRQYQQCTNRQKQPKQQNDHWCTNRHRSFKTVPTVCQSSKTVETQSKQHKNDHWCTSRHMSTKTVPTVYQKLSKDSQNSKNDYWCTNRHRSTSVTIVNKNLAIANRSQASCAYNTSRAFIGLNITPWPWNLD